MGSGVSLQGNNRHGQESGAPSPKKLANYRYNQLKNLPSSTMSLSLLSLPGKKWMMDDLGFPYASYLPSKFRRKTTELESNIVETCQLTWLWIESGNTYGYANRVASTSLTITPEKHFVSNFYATLFEINPAIQTLFENSNMERLQKKLFGTLRTILNSSKTTFTERKQILENIAAKHNKFGVHPNHYGYFGVALLSSIEEEVGASYSEEIRLAWTLVISSILQIMLPIALGGAPRCSIDFCEDGFHRGKN